MNASQALPEEVTPTRSTSEQQMIQTQLARVLKSDLFNKSPQLCRFLRFSVEQTLLGRQDNLKEMILGTEVFRRHNPFDPRLDPIVRVEARRLRSKLDEYYATEGATDPIYISFPRGEYVPRFIPVSTDKVPAQTTASILIVEDERLVAKDLENRLRSLGYTIAGSIGTGEAALEFVSKAPPDLVLMDIVLAGPMRGTEAARRIWDRWQVPVVYLTAFSDAVVLEDIKGSEPYGYILKPFDAKQLHGVLQLALSRRARESNETGKQQERAKSDALLSVLQEARITTWEWVVSDPSLSWPESVTAPSRPVLSSTETPVSFLSRIAPLDQDRVRDVFTHAIREQTRIEVTYRQIDENGAYRWAIAIGSTSRANGEIHCTGLQIATDATRPNDKSVDELELFILAAGHDLQEPLRTIKAFTQLLARGHHEDADRVSESVLTHIEGGVDQMLSLVSDLLSYTRLSQEKTYALEFFPLDFAVDAALRNLQLALDESGARVTRGSLPSVLGMKSQIVQLFQNLIANAIKYRREDTTPHIEISCTEEGPYWSISVRDNGMGFDAAKAEYIFRPFKRLHGRAVRGTGLGLAICRRIIEAHGGRIFAESTPGEGSVFHFTLPQKMSQVPAPQEATA